MNRLQSIAAAVLALAAGLLATGLASGARAADAPVTVFAAASMTTAMTEVGALYAARGEAAPKFSFAASSALARQIEQGAAASIFISADEKWMDYLADRKLIVPGTRRSALGNRLVMVAPADRAKPVRIDAALDLKALLGDGRIATGDPAHVPVGRYAEAALRKLGLWAAAEPRLARADNVRAALALVERGEVPFGIVYATDAAISPKVKVAGTFPPDSHPAVSYPFAVIAAHDGAAVRKLFAFLLGAEAQGVYTRLGFAVE